MPVSCFGATNLFAWTRMRPRPEWKRCPAAPSLRSTAAARYQPTIATPRPSSAFEAWRRRTGEQVCCAAVAALHRHWHRLHRWLRTSRWWLCRMLSLSRLTMGYHLRCLKECQEKGNICSPLTAGARLDIVCAGMAIISEALHVWRREPAIAQ